MTTAYYDYHHQVRPDEIDRQGHVSNLRYIAWTLGAASDHSEQCGWTDERRQSSGCDWVVRSHNITYKRSALEGDKIIIRTWIKETQKIASTRGFMICRPADQTLLARGETRWAFVSLTDRRAVPIPTDQVDAFQILPAAPSFPWND